MEKPRKLHYVMPLNENECALIRVPPADDGFFPTLDCEEKAGKGFNLEYFEDAQSVGDSVARIYECNEPYDGFCDQFEFLITEDGGAVYRESQMVPYAVQNGMAFTIGRPGNVLIVPNYKCETCGNRLIPSIHKNSDCTRYDIHYRCPMCGSSCNFDLLKPTWRLRKDD